MTLFFVAAAVLLITPGPAVLYIVARRIDQGRVAGIVSTLGTEATGCAATSGSCGRSATLPAWC